MAPRARQTPAKTAVGAVCEGLAPWSELGVESGFVGREIEIKEGRPAATRRLECSERPISCPRTACAHCRTVRP